MGLHAVTEFDAEIALNLERSTSVSATREDITKQAMGFSSAEIGSMQEKDIAGFVISDDKMVR